MAGKPAVGAERGEIGGLAMGGADAVGTRGLGEFYPAALAGRPGPGNGAGPRRAARA